MSTDKVGPLLEAKIDASTAGAKTLIAAVTGRKIRVYRLFLVFNDSEAGAKFQAGTTDLTGAMLFAAGGSLVLDLNPEYPWFTTGAGEAFVLNLTTGAQVSGRVYYGLV